MSKKSEQVNVLAIYIGSLLTSFVVFMLMYFLISHMFVHTVYFAYIKQTLNMSTVLLSYLLEISLTTMVMYVYDKFKAIYGWGMRVPEMVLHILEALGGTPGALLSQRMFKHKRRKTSFYKITWMILVVQVTFLALPMLVTLPKEQQLIVLGMVLLVLVMLYFLDGVIFLLSSMYSLVVVTAIGFVLYRFLISP